jgi:putative ABC transport system permease protein
MTKALRFSFRLLRREWRAGELRMVALAVAVAVAASSSVGFFTERVRAAMTGQASELLAADAVVESGNPVRVDWRRHARELGLRTAETVTFPSVIVVGDRTKLTEVKAVGPGYPLRGQLRIAQRAYGPDRVTTAIPAPGKVWVDARLLTELHLARGDSVQLGQRRFHIRQILSYEPDRGGDFFSIAPRLMMRLSDLPSTGLVQVGSRLRYHLLVAGSGDAVRSFRHWIKPRLPAGTRLLGVHDARPELSAALDHGSRFLGLAALVSVLLAGVAIAISARCYARRHLDPSAILRCLGASQGFITMAFGAQLLWIALAAGTVGAVAGYLAQLGLATLLRGLVAGPLPAAGPLPGIAGIVTGAVMLLGFGFPPILGLKRVSPARVLRRDLGRLPPQSALAYSFAGSAIIALLWWQTRDAKLALWVLLGSAGTLVALAVTAWLLVQIVDLVRRRGVGIAWRFGIANIARRTRTSIIQMVAFGLGITVMLLLGLVRTELLGEWRASLPADAPNYFVINVQAQQTRAIRQFLDGHGLKGTRLYPMVRARLMAINGKDLDPQSYTEMRARRLAEREQNLSWASRPQSGNRIIAGSWWRPQDRGKHLLSLEKGIAKTLGIRLGDRLRYSVAGQDLVLTVANLRDVNWDSFRVNFFMVTPPGVLDAYPTSYITSFRLNPEHTLLLGELVRHFPNLTVIGIGAIMAKVRTIMDRVSLAVEFVFLFTLAAGVIVLWAAIQTTQDERMQEGAILRTLGARRQQLSRAIVAEFVVLGGLAGFLAGIAASIIGWLLAHQVFHLNYYFDPMVLLLGLVAGAAGVGIAGVVGARPILRRTPVAILRRV